MAGLSGRVVELGSGSGPNFPFYPETVSELVAVEPEPNLRAKALEAARESGRPIRVIDAVGDRLPFADGYFDAAVAVLVLCSVPDQRPRCRSCTACCAPAGSCATTST